MKTFLRPLRNLTLCALLGLCAPAQTGLAQANPAEPDYEALARFQFGQSRQPLALIEEKIRGTAAADYGSIEARLLAVLNGPQTTKDAKRYICRWLGMVGSAQSVTAVAALLGDPDLSHPARMALEPMADPAAGTALREALPKLQGKLLVGVISSIGVRRDPAAVAALGALAHEQDGLVAGTAVAALGEIGSEEAVRALEGSFPAALSLTVARAQLVAAGRLAQTGRNARATTLFESLGGAAYPESIRVAALKGRIAALARTEAARLVIEMLQGEDAAMRAATVSALSASADKGLKDEVAADLPEMKASGQLILLGILGDQPEVAARPAVLRLLGSATDERVKVAALECLVRHADAADVAMLVGLANDKAASVADGARKTLQRMGKPGVDEALIRLIESPRAQDRAVVLSVLASRRAESALPILVRLLNGADTAMATEAGKAIGVMGRPDQLKDVAAVLSVTRDAALRDACVEAARSICRRTSDLGAASAQLVSALSRATTSSARGALFQVMVFTGGAQALSSVVNALQDTDTEVRAAATRALLAWPEAAASPHLVQLARNAPDPGQAVVALRDGCLRLAEMEETPLSQRVEIIRGVLETARRVEEKKRALAALAEVPSVGALELLQSCAQEPGLQADAVRAAITLSRQLGPVYPRQTLSALQGLKTHAAAANLGREVDAAIRAAQNAGQSPEGFVLAWLMAGPYQQEGKDGSALFDIPFPPEQAGASVVWRPLAAPKTGLLELDRTFKGENRVAYIKTEVVSTRNQDAILELGSDDGVKVWLNGKVVLANNAVRPCAPGQDKVKVKLVSGPNSLLLKITQGGGQWAAVCRICGGDGKALADLAVAPNPP